MTELDNEMDRRGYVVGSPGSFETVDRTIEAVLCANRTCENCGYAGLRHKAFVDQPGQTYRAYAECPDCGWADEL